MFEQACLYMNMMDNEPALFVVYQPSLLRADLQRISRIVSLLVQGSHARQVHTPSEAPAVLERPLQECYDPRCSKDPEYDPMLLKICCSRPFVFKHPTHWAHHIVSTLFRRQSCVSRGRMFGGSAFATCGRCCAYTCLTFRRENRGI